jgi:hypothetical protein
MDRAVRNEGARHAGSRRLYRQHADFGLLQNASGAAVAGLDGHLALPRRVALTAGLVALFPAIPPVRLGLAVHNDAGVARLLVELGVVELA